MSFDPDWSLLPMPGIENLPAMQWKIENIKRIPEEKKKPSHDNLRKILGM